MIILVKMKKSLLIPLVFLLYTLIWAILFGFMYTLGFDGVFNEFANKTLTTFFTNLVPSLYYTFPLALLFSVLTTFYYMMRHNTNLILSLSLVLALLALGVFVLIPLSIKINTSIQKTSTLQTNLNLYPSGVIRSITPTNQYVWLKHSDTEKKIYSYIELNSQDIKNKQYINIIPVANFEILQQESKIQIDSETILLPAKDALLTSIITMPPFLSTFFKDISFILRDIHRAYLLNYFSYLVIASIVSLSIFSLFSLCFLSNWRLLNLFLSLVALRTFISSWKFVSRSTKLNGFRTWFANHLIPGYELPFIYGILILLLLIIGIIRIIQITVTQPEP